MGSISAPTPAGFRRSMQIEISLIIKMKHCGSSKKLKKYCSAFLESEKENIFGDDNEGYWLQTTLGSETASQLTHFWEILPDNGT